MEKGNINETEKEYAGKFRFYENHELRKKIIDAENVGIDVKKIVAIALEKKINFKK